MNLGGPEVLIVLAVVLLLFGAKKVPDLARSLGTAQREFKSGLKQEPDQDQPAPAQQPAVEQAPTQEPARAQESAPQPTTSQPTTSAQDQTENGSARRDESKA